MTKTVKDYMAEANAAVPRISVEDAKILQDKQGALIVDVRDGPELAKTGKAAGALHVSRGMLEFRADPDSPYHDPAFAKDRTVIVYCASGGRSALAGKVLKDMGFGQVYNVGGFKDWTDAGGAVDHPIDPGME